MNIIYKLCDPTTGEARYVGLTRSPTLRIAAHLVAAKSTEKDAWIRGLLAEGKEPVLVPIETVEDRSKARMREAAIIRKMTRHGARLLNIDHRLPRRGRTTPPDGAPLDITIRFPPTDRARFEAHGRRIRVDSRGAVALAIIRAGLDALEAQAGAMP